MTSSSHCFFLVLMVVLLQFSASMLTSTKYIDAICNMESVEYKTFCHQTLTAYPPAVAATSLFPLVKIVIGLGVSYAEKTTSLIAEDTKHVHTPMLKTQFKFSEEHYATILENLRVSISEVTRSPIAAGYQVRICYDDISYVKALVGKNRDNASKRLMKMTVMMEKILTIVVAAVDAVRG